MTESFCLKEARGFTGNLKVCKLAVQAILWFFLQQISNNKHPNKKLFDILCEYTCDGLLKNVKMLKKVFGLKN